jgi:hypothetical protein
MINNSQVPNVLGSAEIQSKVASRMFRRTTIATALMMAAVAALAITSLAQSNERATAKSNSIQTAQSTPTPTVPMSLPLDSGEVGPFAFGYLVFENDPAGGIPGFGPLPPLSPAQ